MNGNELFKKSLKEYTGLDGINVDELAHIAGVIARNSQFKALYKAYFAKQSSYQIEDSVGNVTDIGFDWENGEIKIQRRMEIFKLTLFQFLKFLNLIDLCLVKILPLGTVIKLDLDLIPEELRKAYHASGAESLFMISGRKTAIRGSFGEFYVDYIVRLYPFGESEYVQPFLISSMMIKEIVFVGMTNDLDNQFIDSVLREELIYKKSRSIGYLLDDEVTQLNQAIQGTNVANDEVSEDGANNILFGVE